MELDPHTESIDENGNHNPSSKVLAVNDLPERVAYKPPEVHHLPCRSAQAAFLLLGLPAISPVPVVEVLGELVYAFAVGVSRRLVAL